MKKISFFIMGILLPVLSTLAQSPPAPRALSIGDTVPDIVFENVINYPVSKIRLSDLKGKLVILDFWATWCGSCIRQIPKLDSLQGKHADLKIFLVNCIDRTGDTEGNIQGVLDRWIGKHKKTLTIPIAIERRSLFKQLFPHYILPHYVWINSNRKIIAITTSHEVVSENILKALSEPDFALPLKADTVAPKKSEHSIQTFKNGK